MNVFLLSIFKKLSYTVAIGIIITAVLVTLTRSLTPVLDLHRTDLEQWASKLLQTTVTIGQVEASWYHYQPIITLNKTTVFKTGTKAPLLQIPKVSVFFSIPQSLWQFKFVPSAVMITGAHAKLKQTANGQVMLQGLSSFKSETKVTDMLMWLSLQPRVILRDINLHLSGANGQKRFVTLYNLSFDNSESHHRVLGKALLHQGIPTEVNIALKWKGTKFAPEEINGKAYIYISGLSLPQWLKGYPWRNWKIKKGIGSAKIWATWNKGALQKIQSNFQIYGLDLYSHTDKSTHQVNRMSGHVGWKREKGQQVFAGEDLLIDLPDHLWPISNFNISLMPDAKGELSPKRAHFAYLDLSDVQSFLLSSQALLSDKTNEMLNALQVKGAVQNASVTFSDKWTDWRHLTLDANFSHLGFLGWKKIPGVKNISGNIQWNGTQGAIKLNSNHTIFQYDPIFAKPFAIDHLVGDVEAQLNANQVWIFRTPAMQIVNDDLSAKLSGTLTLDKNVSPVSDITANFTMHNAKNITRYLPMRIFEPSLVKWLQQAFLSGQVDSAKVILKGAMNEFPFENGKGTFLISGIVKDVNLRYASDWPVLNHINGRLTFSGDQMDVAAESAQFAGIFLKNIHAKIPHLGTDQQHILEINSDTIQTDLAQATKFINKSPLRKKFGKMFSALEPQGSMMLKLGLTIPLSNTEKTNVLGEMILKNAQLNLKPWQINLADLNGIIHFTETNIEADNIQGKLFKEPLELALKTIKNQESSFIQATLNYHLNISTLENIFKIPLTKFAEGSTTVTTQINLSSAAQLDLALYSDLVGVRVELPDRFGKKLGEARAFSTHIYLEKDQAVKMKLNYGNLLSANLHRDEERRAINDNWNINITSPEVAGQLQIPVNMTSQGLITAKFQRLNLHSTHNLKDIYSNFKINSLPAIYFTADNVSYNEIPLGKVIVKTSTLADRLLIRSLRIVSPHLDLQAVGDWTQDNNEYQTHLQGDASSKNVNELLRSFNIDAHNVIASDGEAHFRLSWHDIPFSPTQSNIKGRLSLKLGPGRIVDIGQASEMKMDLGRMLNIFSLQSIPRRFALDFSDIFQKGYSFDSIRGDFNIRNGNIYTNNSNISGTVAGVSINGRIGFEDKDYDLTLTVVPHVTSSIPIAATIITLNPLIGVAAWAVDKVTNPLVNKATSYSYVIKGPWNSPNWEAVNVARR